MKRIIAAGAVAAAAALLLTGCGKEKAPAPSGNPDTPPPASSFIASSTQGGSGIAPGLLPDIGDGDNSADTGPLIAEMRGAFAKTVLAIGGSADKASDYIEGEADAGVFDGIDAMLAAGDPYDIREIEDGFYSMDFPQDAEPSGHVVYYIKDGCFVYDAELSYLIIPEGDTADGASVGEA